MLTYTDNKFNISPFTHSIGLRNNLTIPMPGWDQNPLIAIEKKNLARGLQGLGGLSFDGTGLLGTGLFSGDISTWGVAEVVFGLIGAYAVYSMFFQAKQTKYRMEISAGRRRKRRAVSLRAKAKRLEEQTEGIF